jgi:hypothetical protein
LEDHSQFSAIIPKTLDDLLGIVHIRHFANTESIIFFQYAFDILQIFMQMGPSRKVSVTILLFGHRIPGRSIWQSWLLADKVDDIHSESRCSGSAKIE